MKKIEIDEFRELQMQILDYVDAFCRTHDIKYTISGGTLLGAVRHGGFIPWDDDMDIQMLRSEYEKFTAIWNQNKEIHPYEFVSIESGNSMGYTFGKMHNPDTVTYLNGDERTGVFIDIFPIDDVRDALDCKKRHEHIRKLYSRMMAAYALEIDTKINFLRRVIYRIRSFGKTRLYYAEQISRIAQNSNHKGYNMVFELVSGFKCKDPIYKYVFENMTDIHFENRVYMSVKDYDMYLTNTFGNYMTPPPPEKQKRDHSFVPYWK